jgi:hypothetical protein
MNKERECMLFFLPQTVRQKLKGSKALVRSLELAILLVVNCCLFVFGFMLTEQVDLGEACWQVYQTITTIGYGNRPATTSAGRNVTVVFGLVGIALVGALISSVFDIKAEREEKRRLGIMKCGFKNHYLIVNFPGVGKFTTFAEELVAVGQDVKICIVDSLIEQLPESVLHLSNVEVQFVRGPLFYPGTFQRAAVSSAKKIVVFPQNPGVSETDATTNSVVEIVGQLCSPDAQVVHVLVDPNNKDLFKGCISTSVSETSEILLLVQECQDQHSARMIQSILSNKEGANPCTVKPSLVIGWTWARFVRCCMAISEAKNIDCNPLALIDKDRIDACPKPSALITESHSVSLLVPNGFDWDSCEQELAQYDRGG